MAKKKYRLIAEKPSLMREIMAVYKKHQDEFDFEIDFVAQAGHLVGLKLPKEIDAEKYGKWNLADFPQEYPYIYKVNPGKEELVKKIKTGINDFDGIIHAGDPDQEGELLVRLVLQHIGCKLPILRFWSNDLTEPALLAALHNLQPDSNYDHIYEAALVRQHIDYSFGMNCTGTISCITRELCKTGRVKAAITSIIAKRELDIRNYVEKKTYKPAFRYKDCDFVFDKVFETPEEAVKGVPKTEYADVVEANYTKKNVSAPELFKLASLQTECSKRFGWSADFTLSVAQTLYEAKAISYPRTTIPYISKNTNIGGIAKKLVVELGDEGKELTKLLVKEPSDVLKIKKYFDEKKIAESGHTGLIPTGNGAPKNMDENQKLLYDLVVKRFLALFGADKEVMNIKVTANPSGTKDPYVYTEAYDIAPGYELIINPSFKCREASGVEFKNGMNLHPIEFFAKEIVSTKPSRFNSGSLIEYLDKFIYEAEDGQKYQYSIGTPATRASIVAECINNGYFHEIGKGKQKSYEADDKAIAIYEAYKDVPLFNPVESGKWEEMLESIRTGEVNYKDIEDKLFKKMEESIEMIKNAKVATFGTSKNTVTSGKKGEACSCPNCKSPVLKGKFGIYCSKKCGMMFGKAYGKELTESEWVKLLSGKKVLVKGFTSKAGKPYDAYLEISGVNDFTYTNKENQKVDAKTATFNMTFPPKGK